MNNMHGFCLLVGIGHKVTYGYYGVPESAVIIAVFFADSAVARQP